MELKRKFSHPFLRHRGLGSEKPSGRERYWGMGQYPLRWYILHGLIDNSVVYKRL